jgi:hypothetical protein
MCHQDFRAFCLARAADARRPKGVDIPTLTVIRHLRAFAAGFRKSQGDSQVFKKYSRMKLQMQREALAKLNRHANEMPDLETRNDTASNVSTRAVHYGELSNALATV